MSEPVAVAPTFFNPRTRPAAQRWVASAIAWALAAALTVGAAHGSGAKFVFFWFAVLFAAWVSGIGAAALSAVSAAILVGILRHQAGMSPTDEVTTIVLWLVPLAFGSVLAATLASQSSALARYAVELQRAIDSARAAGVEVEAQRAALERSNELLQEQAAELEMQAEELQTTTATLEERTEESEATARRALFAADVGTTLVSGGSLDAMMQGCCQAAVDHLGAAFARVWVLDEQEPTPRRLNSDLDRDRLGRTDLGRHLNLQLENRYRTRGSSRPSRLQIESCPRIPTAGIGSILPRKSVPHRANDQNRLDKLHRLAGLLANFKPTR